MIDERLMEYALQNAPQDDEHREAIKATFEARARLQETTELVADSARALPWWLPKDSEWMTEKGTLFDTRQWINDMIHALVVGGEDGMTITLWFDELMDEHGQEALYSVLSHLLCSRAHA